jgi:hypothetical protein
MKRSIILASVATAAVLGTILTMTTIGTGIFLQQASASNGSCVQFANGCRTSDPNSFGSNAFVYNGMNTPGQPYLYHETPNPPPTSQPPIVYGQQP